MKTLFVAFLLLLLPTTVMAQRPKSPDYQAQHDAMQKLQFLVGDWKGEGWIEFGGQHSAFTSSEVVESKLDGLVVLVHGLHTVDIPGRPEPMVIHDAFGVFTYDAEAGHYRFRTHLAEGYHGDYTATMEGDTLIWTMQNPQLGDVRYLIRLNEQGQWHEIGERSADGETWQQFFEMTLDQVER